MTALITRKPLENHAQQMLLFGFGLGVDILLMLDVNQLDGSNIPSHIKERFPSKSRSTRRNVSPKDETSDT